MDTSKNPNECDHKWGSRVFCWECSVIGCMDCHMTFPIKIMWNKSDKWLCPKCKDTSEYAEIWKQEKELQRA